MKHGIIHHFSFILSGLLASSFSFSFIILVLLKNTDQMFCRTFLHIDLSDIYHHRLRLWILGKNTTEVKCSSRYIVSDTKAMCLFISDVKLGQVINPVSSSFFHCEVTIIHLSCSSHWRQFMKEENIIQQTHSGNMVFEVRDQESF